MELNEVKIRDLMNQKEQLLKEKQDLSDCIENINRELEHIKSEEIKNIFEIIKPYLDRLEKLRAFVTYKRYTGAYDPCTNTTFPDVGGYVIEMV